MARETGVQSQVESYQRPKKWYLILPCLTLSIIRYVSRVKWSNPAKGVVPPPTPRCSSYWKGSFRVALDYGHQLYLLLLFYSFETFSHQCKQIVFQWILSDGKSPQDSRTLCILASLNNAVIWMVSASPFISKSSIPFTNPLGIVPRAPVTIII